ncbi:MAG: hypothetical protein E7Z97_02985 [Propionibacteriaceae bacterium]|nr:hypothetical protein [Propionibacteriaceae bacterium]
MIGGPWVDQYPPATETVLPPVTDDIVSHLGLETVDPDRIAMRCHGRTLTYGRLIEAHRRVAAGLAGAGLGPGDRVAVIAGTGPEHLIALLAALRLGAIVVEHDTAATSHELAGLFADHGARLAFTDPEVAPRVPGDVRTVVLTGEHRAAPAHPPGSPVWADLSGHAPLGDEAPRPAPQDTALLLYTSGSTGRPKGVPFTHAMIGHAIDQNLNFFRMQGRGDGRHYLTLPLNHVFALVDQLFSALARAVELIAFRRGDIDAVVAAAATRPPRKLGTVPPVLDAIAAGAARAGVRFDDLYVATGGLPLTRRTVDAWLRISDSPPVNGWGMTESCGYGLMPLPDPARVPAGSCGVPLPDLDVRVCDPADPTRELGVGETGELQLRGRLVFGGYWNDPRATAEAFTRDGFLRTGDLVSMDGQGFFFFHGRLKEIISVQGENVSPVEVERVLEAAPGIARAFVYPRETTPGVNILLAAFTAAPGTAADPDAALALCAERLAPYKVPMRLTRVDALPLSAAGKLRRDVDGQAWTRAHRVRGH